MDEIGNRKFIIIKLEFNLILVIIKIEDECRSMKMLNYRINKIKIISLSLSKYFI